MNAILKQLVQLCLLRTGPQDLPSSPNLLMQTTIAYIITNMLATIGEAPFLAVILAPVLDAAITLGLLKLLLQAKNLGARFTQAASALMGSLALAQLVTAPLMKVLSPAIHEQRAAIVSAQSASEQVSFDGFMPVLIIMAVAIWYLAIMANILRHTFEVKMSKAVLMTFGIKFVTVIGIVTIAELFVTPATVAS